MFWSDVSNPKFELYNAALTDIGAKIIKLKKPKAIKIHKKPLVLMATLLFVAFKLLASLLLGIQRIHPSGSIFLISINKKVALYLT